MSIKDKAILLNSTDRKLLKIHESYEENFENLMRSVGTDDHKKFVAIERRLNSMSIKRQSELGVIVSDNPSLHMEKIMCSRIKR